MHESEYRCYSRRPAMPVGRIFVHEKNGRGRRFACGGLFFVPSGTVDGKRAAKKLMTMRKNRNRLLQGCSVVLVLALAAGGLLGILKAERREPENPISQEPAPLLPENLAPEQGNMEQFALQSGTGITEPPEIQPEEQEDTQPTEPEPADSTESRTESQPTDTQPTEEISPDAEPAQTEPTSSGPAQDGPSVSDPTDPTGPAENPGEDRPGGPDDEDPGIGPQERVPHIVTDLVSRTITPRDLADGRLLFYAYPAGGDGLTLKVYCKEQNAPENNGTLLHTDETQHYAIVPELNHSYVITMYLFQNGVRYGQAAVFYVTYRPELADGSHPEVGAYPPIITTNRDGITDPVKNQTFTLVVSVRTGDDKIPIFANHIQVWLDGEPLKNPTGSAYSGYEYVLHFQPPQDGDRREYSVSILAWDEEGNSSFRTLTIVYETVSEGDMLGTARIRIDLTTVGLGIADSEAYEVAQGETAAQTVLRMLEDCGYYQVDYSGVPVKNGGFYLIRIHRGDLLRNARIDDRLWELIQRDGITLTSSPGRDSLGEHDYTWGAGWMYDVNGYFPGKGLSDYYLADGDTLTLRFTLAWGKDINGYGSTGGAYGSLSGYCGIWRDGSYTALSHDFREESRTEPTDTEDGCIEYACTKCGETKREVLPALHPTEPTEPTNPSEPTEPSEPSEPTEPTEPTEPVEPPTDPTDAIVLRGKRHQKRI